MGFKLKAETRVQISASDMCDILTEHLCGSSYDAFANLRVSSIDQDAGNGDFDLILLPKPPKPEQKDAA